MLTSELPRRLFAAMWFALAATIPVGLSFLFTPMSSGKIFQIVTTSGSIFAAGVWGFWLGAGILDERKTRSALGASGRGLAIAGLSYLLLVVIEIVVFVAYNRDSISDTISTSIYTIAIIFSVGLIFFGWLIAVVGAAAGALLYVVRNKTVESDTNRCSSPAGELND